MTRYADRKAKIRAYQAAHPGMTYRQAARRLEAENQTFLPLFAVEPPVPLAEWSVMLKTLAATLVELGQSDLAQTIAAAVGSWDRNLMRPVHWLRSRATRTT